MEPMILQFILKLPYGCVVGKHPNDFLLAVFIVSSFLCSEF